MEDEAAPPSSLVRAGLTISEARVHYTNMLREEEAKFWQAQVDQAYNLGLLEEHQRMKELLAIGATIMPDVDAVEQ